MQTALPEAALETLAAVFRTMPHYPLLDEPSAAALYGDYEGWAQHLLTGTPPPGLVRAPTPQRQWGQAQLFFREHRVAEQLRVQHREREYSALAQDLLVALRDARPPRASWRVPSTPRCAACRRLNSCQHAVAAAVQAGCAECCNTTLPSPWPNSAQAVCPAFSP